MAERELQTSQGQSRRPLPSRIWIPATKPQHARPLPRSATGHPARDWHPGVKGAESHPACQGRCTARTPPPPTPRLFTPSQPCSPHTSSNKTAINLSLPAGPAIRQDNGDPILLPGWEALTPLTPQPGESGAKQPCLQKAGPAPGRLLPCIHDFKTNRPETGTRASMSSFCCSTADPPSRSSSEKH